MEEDYKYLEPEFERLAPGATKPRVLLDMTGLHGWDAGAAWEEIKFDARHFGDIERIAVVGEKPWQHGMATLFCALHQSRYTLFPRQRHCRRQNLAVGRLARSPFSGPDRSHLCQTVFERVI